MPAGFESEGKALVADVRANEKFHRYSTNHCDGLSRYSMWATAEVLRRLDRCPSPLHFESLMNLDGF